MLVNAISAALAATAEVHLTVAYCPTMFSGEGAVVKVDPQTGAFSIVKKFALKQGSIGCPMNEDPNFLSTSHTTYLSFSSDWGAVDEIDLEKGTVHTLQSKTKDGSIFDGFTSMALASSKGKKLLKGLTPAVTESGYCSDGCFRFGEQELSGFQAGVFSGFAASAAGLPFKAVMSDAAFYDAASNTYYAQGSYPLTNEAACGEDETEQCLFAVDAVTGNLLSSKSLKNTTIYGYMPHQTAVANENVEANASSVLAWFEDFHECGIAYGHRGFAFARIDLATASLTTPVRCISKNVTLHEKPGTSAFSPDGALLATGSGNPEVGSMQLLVFDTATGSTVLNSKLDGLKEALGVTADAPFVAVWGIAFF